MAERKRIIKKPVKKTPEERKKWRDRVAKLAKHKPTADRKDAEEKLERIKDSFQAYRDNLEALHTELTQLQKMNDNLKKQAENDPGQGRRQSRGHNNPRRV